MQFAHAPLLNRSLSLNARLRRFIFTLDNTLRQRGLWAAGVFLLRALLHRGPILLRQVRAARQTAQIVTAFEHARVTSDTGTLHLGVAVSGGLGDMLVIARFLRDFSNGAGDVRIDVFSSNPALATWAFKGLRGFSNAYHDLLFDNLLPQFDVALRACQFVVVYKEHVKWSRLREQPALVESLDQMLRFRREIDVFINHHPFLDNHLARVATFNDASRRNFLHVMSGIAYGGDAFPLHASDAAIERCGLGGRRYITVHNGFDTGFLISGKRATKCYPHFGAVVARLKEELPDVLFVQLGAKTSENIDACDINLVNKTSLPEAAGLIAGAELHIDNEGGLVHVASCLGRRAAVVFGPTPADFFGYEHNINIAPPVCGNCWWMKTTWMDICPKGYAAPKCMTEQDPLGVAERILTALGATSPVPAIAAFEAAVD